MPHRTIRQIIANQQLLALSATISVSEAADRMRRLKVGAVAVVAEGRLVGVFTERDALFRVVAEGRDARTTPLAEVMTPDPQTIHPAKPFGHALHMMFEGGFRHVPVVEDGRPVGMVSARDALGPELREFVSDLGDRDHISEIL